MRINEGTPYGRRQAMLRRTALRRATLHRCVSWQGEDEAVPRAREVMQGILGGTAAMVCIAIAAFAAVGSGVPAGQLGPVVEPTGPAPTTAESHGPTTSNPSPIGTVSEQISVMISEVETWTEYRRRTNELYTDEKGETHPRYELMHPATGNIYLRVVAHVACEVPRSWTVDEITLTSSPSHTGSTWKTAPMVRFDARGLPVPGSVTESSQKIALDLLYEAPAHDWPDYYITIGDRSYGPLSNFSAPVPIAGEVGSSSL